MKPTVQLLDNNNLKVCAIVNIFYPEDIFTSYLVNNISYIDKFFLMNNGAMPDFEESIVKLGLGDKCVVINQDQNLGVSKSFNNGIKLGIKQGYNVYILLDQDTKILLPLDRILRHIDNNPLSNEICFLSWSLPTNNNKDNLLYRASARQTISSGTILTKKIVDDIGLMDETLYIDLVDYEYALRAHYNKYKLLKTREVYLDHKIGKPVKSLFGLIGSSNHPHNRRFFKARNSMILFKRFFFKDFKSIVFLNDVLKTLILILLIEERKLIKLKSIFRGLAWGLNDKPLPKSIIKEFL